MFRKTIALIVLSGSFLFASGALASPPTVVDQYTEQVPTPGGEKPTPTKTAPKPDPGSVATTPTVPDGSGGTVDSSTDPTSSGQGNNESDAKKDEDATKAETKSGASDDEMSQATVAGQSDDTDDAGGMGIVFPIALVLIALGGLAAFFLKRRADSSPAA